jgi:DNA-binding transcriptional regulator YdaS (Cro superfamily)
MANEEFRSRFAKFDAASKAFGLTDMEMGWLLNVTPVMVSRYRHGRQAMPQTKAGELTRAMMIVMAATKRGGPKRAALDWATLAVGRALPQSPKRAAQLDDTEAL